MADPKGLVQQATDSVKNAPDNIKSYLGQKLTDEQKAHLEKEQGKQGDGSGGSIKLNVDLYSSFAKELHAKRDAWEKAINENVEVLRQTTVVGIDSERRKEGLDAIHTAQREYFALIDCAMPKDALQEGVMPLLNEADWATMADARSKQIEDFKATHYPEYHGIISAEQRQRAMTLVQGGYGERLRRYAMNENLDKFFDQNWIHSNDPDKPLTSFSELYGEHYARQYMFLVTAAAHIGEVCQGDVEAYIKVAGKKSTPGEVDSKDIPTLQETFKTLAMAAQFDYWQRAQKLREYRNKQGARSVYGDFVDAGFSSIDEERVKLLKEHTKNNDGPPFMINGVKFEKTASVSMSFMRMAHPLDIFGFGWGQEARMADIEALVKAFIEATADANGVTTSEAMLLYAKDPKVKVDDGSGNEEEPENQNLRKKSDGSLGEPINKVQISGMNASGGVIATREAIADQKALYEILGMSVEVNLKQLQESVSNSDYQRHVMYEALYEKGTDVKNWANHEATLMKEARDRIAIKYKFDPKDTDEQKREKVRSHMFGPKPRPAKEMAIERVGQVEGALGGIKQGSEAKPVSQQTMEVNKDARKSSGDVTSATGAPAGHVHVHAPTQKLSGNKVSDV